MKSSFIKTFAFLGTLVVSLAFFGVSHAQTATQFNTNPNDLDTVKVMNVTDNPNSTTAWYPSITADPGDLIAVRVYYHNTGAVAAQNTTVRAGAQSSGAVHSQSFSGSVTASNCTNCPHTGMGYVSINGSQAQTVTFVPGSGMWYAEHSTGGTPLTASQEAAFIGSGFNMGTIQPDSTCPNTQTFCHQGTVRAQYRISNTQPPAACTINYFTATPAIVSYNASSTLSWSVSGASSANISSFSGNVTIPTGTKNTGPLQNDQSYTLTVNCQNGTTKQQTVYIDVNSAPVCTAAFSASDTTIDRGESTTLNWTTSNASYVSINPGNAAHLGNNSYLTVAPTSTTTYTLTVNCNDGTTIVRTVTITVKQPSVANCTITDFSGPQTPIPYGSSTNLFWSTSNCTTVSISGLGSQDPNDSTSTGNLISDTVYTLTANGPHGTTQTRNFTVHVTEQSSQGYCAINSFNASPSSVVSGGITTLSWSTSNDCTNISISSIGPVGTSGSKLTNPIYGTTTYTLSASILGGVIKTETLIVNVTTSQQQTYACNDGFDNDGDGHVDMNDPGCAYPTDNDESNQINPQAYACNDGRDNDNDGYVDMNDPGCLYPTDNDEYNYVQQNNLAVSTLVASGVGETSANLNGYLTSGNTTCMSSTSTWFQWGSTYSLGATTAQQTVYGNQTFSAPIYNLAPSTTYYFRAVASNCSGTVYGNILSFRTRAQTGTGPVVIYTGGGGGTTPLMTLTIESRYDTYAPGDAIDYVVTYKNIAKRTTLHDVVVHIQLPLNVENVRNTRGEYSLKDNTVTVDVGTLNPQEEESFFIDGMVKVTAKNGDALVASGTAAYVYGNNIQDDVVAYSMDSVSGTTLGFLGALTLFGADGLFPNTLIGWLVFILIVLLLIMLGRKAFAPTRFVKQVAPTHLPH